MSPNLSELHIIHTPAIPGPALTTTSMKAALREIRNAEKAGLGRGAWINTVHVRRRAA